MARYRILALDGGGIRGIVTAILLERLNAEPRISGWLDSADLIAGTSTGGLLALGLAKGLTPGAMRSLYENKGHDIFDDSWLDDLLDLGRIAGADYDISNLARELRRIFGPTTLGELHRRVLIPSFDLDNEAADEAQRTWKPKLFHNFPGPDSDGSVPAWKVGLYTSAAPTFFPSVDGYVDGGVYASNPAMCALAQALDARSGEPAALAECALLSLGTGTSLVYIRGRSLDWGYAQWAKPLIALMMDGTAGIADYQCARMLGSRYHRLAPAFAPGVSIPLDAVDRIPELRDFAQGIDLSATVRWIETQWLAHRGSRSKQRR
ncbi:MAG: patatin-like phospholipase family protein [Rhodocyclaceae bacterium]